MSRRTKGNTPEWQRKLNTLNARLKKIEVTLDLNDVFGDILDRESSRGLNGLDVASTETKMGQSYHKIVVDKNTVFKADEMEKRIDSLAKLIPTMQKMKKQATAQLKQEAKDQGQKVVIKDPKTQENIKSRMKDIATFNDQWKDSAKNFYELSDLLGALKENNAAWKEAYRVLKDAGKQRRDGKLNAARALEAIKKAEQAVKDELERQKKKITKAGDDWE